MKAKNSSANLFPLVCVLCALACLYGLTLLDQGDTVGDVWGRLLESYVRK